MASDSVRFRRKLVAVAVGALVAVSIICPIVLKGAKRVKMDQLVKRLQSPNGNVVRAAAEEILTIGPSATKSLIESLKSGDTNSRRWDIWLLGVIGGEQTAEPLVACLKDGDDCVRWTAIHALGVIEDPRAVDGLLAALNDPHCANRSMAAWALGKSGDARVVAPLIASFETDAELGVREAAAWALGKIGDPEAIPVLVSALSDPKTQVRIAAAKALGDIRNVAAVNPLTKSLKDESREVRKAAVLSLGLINDKRAISPLINSCLRDSSREVAVASHNALIGMGKAAVGPLLSALPGLRGRNSDLIIFALACTKDPRAVDISLRMLKSPSPSTRLSAAAQLFWEASPRSVPDLINALKDEHVNHTAASALGVIRDRRAVEPLVKLLQDKRSFMRSSAATALGEIGDPRALEPLVALLKDHDPIVRCEAAKALGDLGDVRAADALVAALSDDYFLTRENAVASLGRLRAGRALKPLIRIVQDEDDHRYVRQKAAVALAQIGRPRGLALLDQAVRRGDLVVVAGAHEHFIRKGDRATILTLIDALRVYGDSMMQIAYFHSGNRWLADAGWFLAKSRGEDIDRWPVDEKACAKWGSGCP